MAWDFHVWQRVQCIDDDWHLYPGHHDNLADCPKRGVVYTIREVRLFRRGERVPRVTFSADVCFLRLLEFAENRFFGCNHFRPLDECRLDQFRAHLALKDPEPAVRRPERERA